MKTIAAISTPLGVGGVGVIRVSGSDSFEIVEKIFKPFDKKCKLSQINGYTAKYGEIIENKMVIDEAVVLIFKAPRSYTGENVVEISCHGGLYLTKKILRLVLEAGAILASAGEFTKRAFLNGKISLHQAEAVMDLISSSNERTNKYAISLKKGATDEKINKLKNNILNLLAQINVWIDYSDEEFAMVESDALEIFVSKIKSDIKNLIKNYDIAKIIKNGIKVAIIGAPNVGKSTFMNYLIGYEKSIVTEIAGTTRDVVEESCYLGDILLSVSDTAGIHDTNDFIEKIGIEKAKSCLEVSDILFFVVDGSKSISANEKIFLSSLDKKKLILLLNKSDLPQKVKKSDLVGLAQKIVSISAKKKSGREELEKAVYDILGLFKADVSEEIISNERQYDVLNRAIRAIDETKNAMSSGAPLDAISVLMQEVLQIFLELTGENASDTVIDKIFSNFCVGK